MTFFSPFVEGRFDLLKNHVAYKVTGEDRIKFFQGQTTNDVDKLMDNSFQLNSRVERSGKLQFFFYLLKSKNSLTIVIDKNFSEAAIEEFNKFIIMDDVEITPLETDIYFSIGAKPLAENSYSYFLYGLPAHIYLDSLSVDVSEISELEISELSGFFGWPRNNIDVRLGQLINETRLDELSISYDKGCFLGQETVAKVHNGRGASYVPVKIKPVNEQTLSTGEFKINGRKGGEIFSSHSSFSMGKVFREFRIENKEFELEFENTKVICTIELYNEAFSLDQFAHELYLHAVSLFQNSDERTAIEYLKAVISLNPTFADAYESLGVIYGRQGAFEKGIELMDELLKVNEDSVMAHTNKSLYLMNLGKIEEAEEEKGLATVKSFAKYGKEAKEKRDKEAINKEKEEQMLQRESMFKQVLEIDDKDTIANFGMADILFYRENYLEAKKHLEVVLSEDDKYSTAYLLLGKTLELLESKSEAKEIYEKGISVASAKGELMPANEMQSRLVKL